jgi:hypothetical protein
MSGKTIFNSLIRNYAKNQNSKFPQTFFKIVNLFTVFGYIYNFLMTGRREMHTKFLGRTPQGKGSVERRKHGWDYSF